MRVGEGGSAALELANDTLLRLGGLSAVSIRRHPNAATPTVRIERGRGHFLSRTRQRFDASTPYLNAAIDGTEFLLVAAPAADELVLFEGRVTVDGRQLMPGQSLRVTPRRQQRAAPGGAQPRGPGVGALLPATGHDQLLCARPRRGWRRAMPGPRRSLPRLRPAARSRPNGRRRGPCRR